jgi:3-dehydroquinate synthase
MFTKKLTDTVLDNVVFGRKGWEKLNNSIKEKSYTSIFVLVDSNTKSHCLGYFESHFQHDFKLLTMEAGEPNKHLETCSSIWASLSDEKADRNALLIHVGGGVVTDLGGFVACTYKRGIDFVNIPTSLLAMVDASVGGKTGVDFQGLKNQIGIIREPEFVVIDSNFLSTLPENEFRSGYAEMLKHGLIADADYFEKLASAALLQDIPLDDFIAHSVHVKSEVVKEDPFEKGLRKILNYGHTLGHAIETHFLSHPTSDRLLHGEAIAIGMIMEAELSYRTTSLSLTERDRIKEVFTAMYTPVVIQEADKVVIKSLLQHDKKNQSNQIRFVLLEKIGKAAFDQLVSDDDIESAFAFYSA